MTSFVLAISAILVGATLQRTTGLGFTLVSGPFLVLVLSAYDGVALANLLSLVTCLLVLASTWRGVDVRSAALLSAGAAVAILPGAALARALPEPALLVLVGTIAVAATVAVTLGRTFPGLSSSAGAGGAGFLSGFSNVTAGIGGPALAVYGASVDIARVRFVPTVQVVGIFTNGLSLIAKSDAELPAPLVVLGISAVLAGLVLGHWLSKHINDRKGRQLVLGLAILGGLASISKGVATW